MSMQLSDRSSYGGFWIRVGAYLMDTTIMLIPTLLISFFLHSIIPTTTQRETAFVNLIADGCNLLTWWAYTAAFLSSSWQATPGKKICGLKVIDYDGNRISLGRATGRYFASLLDALTLGVGVFMVAWTARRQSLHDMIANTLVIKNAA
jgi:uncharacterized RDD family membrane protein YckC